MIGGIMTNVVVDEDQIVNIASKDGVFCDVFGEV